MRHLIIILILGMGLGLLCAEITEEEYVTAGFGRLKECLIQNQLKLEAEPWRQSLKPFRDEAEELLLNLADDPALEHSFSSRESAGYHAVSGLVEYYELEAISFRLDLRHGAYMLFRTAGGEQAENLLLGFGFHCLQDSCHVLIARSDPQTGEIIYLDAHNKPLEHPEHTPVMTYKHILHEIEISLRVAAGEER